MDEWDDMREGAGGHGERAWMKEGGFRENFISLLYRAGYCDLTGLMKVRCLFPWYLLLLLQECFLTEAAIAYMGLAYVQLHGVLRGCHPFLLKYMNLLGSGG